MPDLVSVLGQSAPGAAALTDLYTCPALTQAVISSLTICNRSATATTFRVAVRPAGAAIANQHYVYYDVTLAGNDTFVLTGGLTLEATDVVSVWNTLATLSFSLFGVERT
jgi:hypothetical protein